MREPSRLGRACASLPNERISSPGGGLPPRVQHRRGFRGRPASSSRRRSVRDAREIRGIHHELATLVKETKALGESVHEIQCEIRDDQREAKGGIEDTRRAVEQVNETVVQVSSAVEQVTDAIGGREAA